MLIRHAIIAVIGARARVALGVADAVGVCAAAPLRSTRVPGVDQGRLLAGQAVDEVDVCYVANAVDYSC